MRAQRYGTPGTDTAWSASWACFSAFAFFSPFSPFSAFALCPEGSGSTESDPAPHPTDLGASVVGRFRTQF